jgi:hypothetical protein
MSNEEMNRKMEFIVEHQAKFAAEIEIMREVQAAESKRLKDALLGVVEIVGSLTRSQMASDARIDSLAESQMRTDESLKRLSEAQARTEESLNILLNTVERHIHGNGGPANPS